MSDGRVTALMPPCAKCALSIEGGRAWYIDGGWYHPTCGGPLVFAAAQPPAPEQSVDVEALVVKARQFIAEADDGLQATAAEHAIRDFFANRAPDAERAAKETKP
jgi:hypothetical protein